MTQYVTRIHRHQAPPRLRT